jgi:hypothetical protein
MAIRQPAISLLAPTSPAHENHQKNGAFKKLEDLREARASMSIAT